SVPVNALIIDPDNTTNLYAGTDIGVYASTDSGATWAPFGSGMPVIPIFDLAIQRNNRVLRAATHGRGVWEASIATAGASITITSNPSGRTFSVTGSNCSSGSYITPQVLTWTAGASCTVTMDTPQNGTTGILYNFSGWADGPATNPRVITAPASDTTFAAN